MSKDYDTYINNELTKLVGYANYLLDFNRTFVESVYGLHSDMNAYNRNRREKEFK